MTTVPFGTHAPADAMRNAVPPTDKAQPPSLRPISFPAIRSKLGFGAPWEVGREPSTLTKEHTK